MNSQQANIKKIKKQFGAVGASKIYSGNELLLDLASHGDSIGEHERAKHYRDLESYMYSK